MLRNEGRRLIMPRKNNNARKNYADRPCFTEMANMMRLNKKEREKLMKEHNIILSGLKGGEN